MLSNRVKEPQWKYWITLSGSPASAKISCTCSAIVGVCGEGLIMTELPASRAGIKELTKMRYGYYEPS